MAKGPNESGRPLSMSSLYVTSEMLWPAATKCGDLQPHNKDKQISISPPALLGLYFKAFVMSCRCGVVISKVKCIGHLKLS